MLLLTGATGYLGSGIARELIARREPFRVLVRDAKRLGFDPARSRCEVAIGDLRDPEALRAALQGVDAVIHTAALVKMWVRDRRDFWRINVEGLQNLLQAAEQAGVQRVVYTSSFLALGPSADVNADERLRHAGPFSDAYEESKARALEWLRSEGLRRFPVIVMFPGVIYGPGPKTDGNLVGGMIYQYLAGKFPGILGSGEQRWSFAFNANVVNAHLAALRRASRGRNMCWAEIIARSTTSSVSWRISPTSGIRFAIFLLPWGKFAGALEVMRARAFGHSPQLTPGVVEIFKHDWVYSSAKAIRDLDYWVAPLEEGLLKDAGGEERPPVIQR